MAYQNHLVGMHAAIKVRVTREIEGREYSAIIDATLGRLIFNRPIPQDLGFVKRPTIAELYDDPEHPDEPNPEKVKQLPVARDCFPDP